MALGIPYCLLPFELIIEILLRLPVKSLSRFKSVCIQWRDIITRTKFMHDHFHRESNQLQLLAYWSAICSPDSFYNFPVYGFYLFMGEALAGCEEPDYLQLPGHVDLFVGPCNGIFCIANTCNKLALWNPSTRKMRPLPTPPRFSKNDEIGFGVDPLTDEVKIVLIHTPPHFSSYTLSEDTWKYSTNETLLKDSILSINECGTTFSKGVFYWRKYNRRTSTSVILGFDTRNEFFLEIEMPNDIRHELFQESILNDDGILLSENVTAQRRAVLDLFEDSLAMFCYDHDVNVGVGNRIDVWVMKEQGFWTKIFNLRLPFNICRPLGFWTRKTFIFSTWAEHGVNEELVLYDPDSGSKTVLRVPGQDCASRIKFWVFKYKESLLPLKWKNESRDYRTQSAVSRGFFAQR